MIFVVCDVRQYIVPDDFSRAAMPFDAKIRKNIARKGSLLKVSVALSSESEGGL